MFGFKKKEKKAKKIPRVFKVPHDNMAEFCRLSDELDNKKGGDKLEKFLFWDFIADLFPAVREGLWRVKYETALDVSIVERFPEDE